MGPVRLNAWYWKRLEWERVQKHLLGIEWHSKCFQIHLMGHEKLKTLFLFQEELYTNEFLYIHLQISHRQQDSSTNLTYPIYSSLSPNINPHVILYKYDNVFFTPLFSFSFIQESE